MVRVGGGWVALDEFLVKNDPCRGKCPQTIMLDFLRNKIITTSMIFRSWIYYTYNYRIGQLFLIKRKNAAEHFKKVVKIKSHTQNTHDTRIIYILALLAGQ